MEEEEEKPAQGGRHIFYSNLAPNKQLTLKKEIRDILGIDVKDIIFLQVIKVTRPNGTTKYEYKPDSDGE